MMLFIKKEIFKNDVEAMGRSLMKYKLMSKGEFEESLPASAQEQNFYKIYKTFHAVYHMESDDPDEQKGYENFINEVLLASGGYKTTTDYAEAAASQNEVMVYCKSYAMILHTPEIMEEFLAFVEKL
jgi:hypothetical protein